MTKRDSFGPRHSTRSGVLFASTTLTAGVAAICGSTVGHVFGPVGVRVGGLGGGLVGVVAATSVARRRGWITGAAYRAATLGGMAGFVAAAAMAVHTLSTPVGPFLSAALVGIGALVGARCTNAR